MKSVFTEPCPQIFRCVAVTGANSASRCTAVNVWVGEQLPTSGSIWEAAGLRLAYMAQHAFPHLEKHMQETSMEYTMWRFAEKNDKESIEFKSVEISVDEKSARSLKWCIDGVSGSVRLCTDPNGDAKKAKMDEREDEPQAALAGIQTKLLMQPGVEKHLGDFGVDPESA